MTTLSAKCHICGRAADRTGSHILTWSLIRELVNKEGEKARGNEVVFSLDPNGVETYIGREQSAEENVVPIKGRPLTEEEIEESKSENPHVRDFIFCTGCEKRLGYMENEAMSRVVVKLRNHTVKNTEGNDVVTIDNGDLLRLFLYSQIWRAGITKLNGFEMEADHQEFLRALLEKCLSDDVSNLHKNVQAHSSEIRSLAIAVVVLEGEPRGDNWIICSTSTSPYGMIINDLSFQIFFNGSKDNGEYPSFFGINTVVDRDSITCEGETQLNVGIISNEVRKSLNEQIRNELKASMWSVAIEKFSKAFFHLIRRKPTTREIDSFISKIKSRGNGKIEIMTADDQYQAAMETIVRAALS